MFFHLSCYIFLCVCANIVHCEFNVTYGTARSAKFAFLNFLENDYQDLVNGKTVTAIANQGNRSGIFKFPRLDTVELKIADVLSCESLRAEVMAYQFIESTGSSIVGVPNADTGYGLCADIVEGNYYSVLVMEPRGNNSLDFLAGKPMDDILGTHALNSLIQTVEQLNAIGMWHGNIHPKNIYVLDIFTAPENSKIFLSNIDSAYYPVSQSSQAIRKWSGDLLYSALTMADEKSTPNLDTEKESVVFCIIHLVSNFLPWEKSVNEYLALRDKKYTSETKETRNVDNEKKARILNDIKNLKLSFQFSDYKQYDNVKQGLKQNLMIILLRDARNSNPTPQQIDTSVATYDEAHKNLDKLRRSLSFLLPTAHK